MTTMILVLGFVGVFAGLFLLFTSVGVLTGERSGKHRTLAAIEALSTTPSSMRRELDLPFVDRAVRPLLSVATSIGTRFAPRGWNHRLEQSLEAAGSPDGWDAQRVFAIKAITLGLGGGLGLLVWGVFDLGSAWLLLAPVLAVGGWLVPDAVLFQLGYERAERIRLDLPDAIDLLTISVEAGLSFDAAAKQVASHTDGPVAEEFTRMLAEMQVGRSRTEAISAMGARADVDELRAFTGAMVQADAFGIPIANVLRVQSKELRVKRRQRAEEKAQKVPVKLLFPLIFLILPCLFIVVLGPALLSVMDALSGQL